RRVSAPRDVPRDAAHGRTRYTEARGLRGRDRSVVRRRIGGLRAGSGLARFAGLSGFPGLSGFAVLAGLAVFSRLAGLALAQQREHDAVELREVRVADFHEAHFSRAIEEERRREAAEPRHLLQDLLVDQRAGVVDLRFRGEVLDQLGRLSPILRVLAVEAHHRERVVLVALHELDEVRDLHPARRAPRAPDVHDRDFALEVLLRDRRAVDGLQLEGEREAGELLELRPRVLDRALLVRRAQPL